MKKLSFRTLVLRQIIRHGASLRAPFLFLLVICSVQGCSQSETPVAPFPVPNPRPSITSRLGISVQDGSGVNSVKVRSIWIIGNIGCAPIHPISGAAITRQVAVDEKVEKMGSGYMATIIDDRFLPGKCDWQRGGYQVLFMRDSQVLANTGASDAELDASGKLELTCIPPPHIPLCDLRSKEVFDRSHFKNVFNATLEAIK